MRAILKSRTLILYKALAISFSHPFFTALGSFSFAVGVRVNHRPVFPRGENHSASCRCYDHPLLIFDPAIDIHTITSFITVFLNYLAFTPDSISHDYEIPGFSLQLPQKSLVSHPVVQKHTEQRYSSIAIVKSCIAPTFLAQPESKCPIPGLSWIFKEES